MNHLQIYKFVTERLQPIGLDETEPDEQVEQIESVPCESIPELLETYNEELEMTDNIEVSLLCMLATVLSTTTHGGQLGLRVIGRPGSAKSTLAEAISCARDYVYPKSKFTGIISGWANLKKSQQTASKMNGMCVMIKDADTMLQLPNLRQVESEIRDALGDGVIRGEYRTGLEFEIETMFTVVQCGTQVLRATDDSALGSRFLDVVIHNEENATDNSESIVRRSINSQFSAITNALASSDRNGSNGSQRKKSIEALGGPTIGFLQHVKHKMREGVTVKPLTKKQETQIYAMSEFIAFCRAKVDRSTKGHILYRPEKELATRLSEQFTRLGMFLAIMSLPSNRRTATFTTRVFDILKKVMKDTAHGFTYEIIQTIFQADRKKRNPEGQSKQDISGKLHISLSQAYDVLQDMKELDMVQTRLVGNPHGAGRKSHYFVLTKEMQKLCRLVL